MLFALLTIVHVIVCLILILVVLLQTGKRADLAGAFGGGGSQTAFGARGAATFLSKATTISAIVFMVTSLALAMLSSGVGPGGGSSILDKVPAGPGSAVPVAPASPPPGSPTPIPQEKGAAPSAPPQSPAPTPTPSPSPNGS